MSTDNYGNEIATHDLDLEYVYPPKSERICAQDERFAGVNEAIGKLEYCLEQHITQCADGLAPLADFISASWAVIDELVTRIEQLEAAQPIPQIQRLPDGDALTAVYMVGLEDGKRSRPTMDSEGVLLSHDAYDELERQAAIGRSVPWPLLRLAIRAAGNTDSTQITAEQWYTAYSWLEDSAPEDEVAE